MRDIARSRIKNYNRNEGKMELIKADINEANREAKKYQEFVDILSYKGYYVKRSGNVMSISSPYYNRNIRLARAFGEDYTFDNIKSRIYRNGTYKMHETNENEKTYKIRIYDGIKIEQEKLKISSFYRLYVHYLYKFGKLPVKNEHKELTPAYFKKKKENTRIFEELNFLARNNFKTIQKVRDYQSSCEIKLPELKSQRENLWRKHNKTTDETQKVEIKTQINLLSEKITTINNYANICSRCVIRFNN